MDGSQHIMFTYQFPCFVFKNDWILEIRISEGPIIRFEI